MSDLTAQGALRKYQKQLDPEGIEVGVSRQALDETLDLVESLQARIAELEPYEECCDQITEAMTRWGWQHCADGRELIEQVDSLLESPWIPVSEPPQILKNGATYAEQEFIGFNGYSVFATTYTATEDDEYSPGFFKHPITHYQPLPQPPEE